MERYRDFGVESGTRYVDGAVSLSTPSYRQSDELVVLSKKLEAFLSPTRIEYATISTIVNEKFVITFEEVVVGEIKVMDRGAISYWRDPKYAQNGVVTKAIKLLVDNYKQYKQLRAFILPNNISSIRAVAKNGFISAGISNEGFHVDGKWQKHEEYIYTIKN